MQLVEEPEAILRERHRDAVGARPGDERITLSAATVESSGQRGDRRCLEQRTHTDVGVEARIDRRDRAHRQDAVPAEVEERVVDTDARHAQQPREDAYQYLLYRSRGSSIVTGVGEVGWR
ncbi:hypothetical protein MOBUDSM44075_04213 [Mycolicibacterium obuense]|uniref:Uncharacterized protein n=1 Tax=Mycolicibacterium obuense TaxID=1807 RepID=A0A0J6YEV8_9MYCO|nr:hypothetical protein MOBUDSM44075_04213 [Mycolicibacterium obuense]